MTPTTVTEHQLSAATNPLLVIGYGNSLRGDDGFGIAVAEALAATAAASALCILARPVLTMELAAELALYPSVVFVDAELGQPAGQLSWRTVLPCENDAASASHGWQPPQLLAWTQLLYGHAPRAELLTCVGKSFALASELSPEVAAALPFAVNLLADFATASLAGSRRASIRRTDRRSRQQ